MGAGLRQDQVMEDVSTEYLEKLKESYYKTKVKINQEEATDLERDTREQSDSNLWKSERKKRITASNVGEICKMMKKTKRSKKVEALLYSSFRGNLATRYGTENEHTARCNYVKYQQDNGHPNLTTQKTGLVVSVSSPWMAASPDDHVHDPDSDNPEGLRV